MSSFAQRTRRTVRNGLRLRCPRCGKARLFRGLFRMNEDCDVCGLHYERESGYFVGAIYINYAATTVVSLSGYFLLDSLMDLTLLEQIGVWCLFATIFPLWFFRYARSLWMTLDHILNPEPPSLRPVRPRRSRSAT